MQDVLSFELLTLKELGAIASEARVPRWSRLKKAELIERLVEAGLVPPTVDELAARRRREQEERVARESPISPPNAPTVPESAERKSVAKAEKIKDAASAAPSPTPGTSADAPTPSNAASKPEADPNAATRALSFKEQMRRRKILGSPTDQNDRLVLTVCDSYWLRARWEATPRSVERVRSAMGPSWHTAEPTIRVYRVDREPHGATRREFVADIPARGGVDVCYIPVDDPPSSFVVELGYLARDKRFFTLVSSGVVETPQRGVHDAFGRPEDAALGFPTNFDAFSPRRFPTSARPSSAFPEESFGFSNRLRADALRSSSDLSVAVDCEIVVKGKVSPGARVCVKEEAIRLKEDGTFSIRYRLPERRHVFPVVATSPDGSETRTIVLAVDRNTKALDPVFRDEESED